MTSFSRQGITDEIKAFVTVHRTHGQLVGDATEPLPNGYQVTITCPCRAVLIRWVTPRMRRSTSRPWRVSTEMDQQRASTRHGGIEL